MRLFLNNNENFEIANISEYYEENNKRYILSFDIINTTFNTITIVNMLNTQGVLNNIYVKNNNDKIIFTTDIYEYLISVNKTFSTSDFSNDIINIQISNINIENQKDPLTQGFENINNNLEKIVEALNK